MTSIKFSKVTTLASAALTATLLAALLLIPASQFSYGQPNQGGTAIPNQGDYGKVVICHVPPGNPQNRHTLTVDASAVPAHMAHGDSLGPCP